MAGGRYRFDNFELDPLERRLFAGETPVELSSRYFDALLLLLQHAGTLLRKEPFLQVVSVLNFLAVEDATYSISGLYEILVTGRRPGCDDVSRGS